jgi:hypothetical protein
MNYSYFSATKIIILNIDLNVNDKVYNMWQKTILSSLRQNTNIYLERQTSKLSNLSFVVM